MIRRPVESASKLKTLADVDEALHELSWLGHQHQATQASIQQELAALKTNRQDRFDIVINGKSITLTERMQQVQSALQTWCDGALDEHLVEPKKSLDMAHGRVGKRTLPLTIECSEGMKPNDVFDKLDRKVGFREKLTEIANKIIGKFTLGMFIEFKPALSMVSLRNAFKADRINAKTLNSYGLSVRKESEQTFFEPAQYETDPNSPG